MRASHCCGKGEKDLYVPACLCRQPCVPLAAGLAMLFLRRRWHEATLMPGAGRLMEHLKAHNVPVALATSSSRDFFERKMSGPNTASLRHHFHVGPVHLAD